MRIDVKDPTYNRDRFSGKVYLDGIEVRDCVAFDDFEGWVEVIDRHDDGKIKINSQRDAVMRKRLTGTVRYVPHNP